jgi:hypothetical protein
MEAQLHIAMPIAWERDVRGMRAELLDWTVLNLVLTLVLPT